MYRNPRTTIVHVIDRDVEARKLARAARRKIRHRAIASIWFEDGPPGWWVVLKPGLQFDGLHSLHSEIEYPYDAVNVRSAVEHLKDMLNAVSRCDCDDCRQEQRRNPGSMHGVWVQLADYDHRRKKHWVRPVFFQLPFDVFMSLRKEYERRVIELKTRVGEEWWFGSWSHTWARKIVEDAGIKVVADSDFYLPSAIYLEVKVMEGTYEDYPPQRGWKHLPNLLVKHGHPE